MASSGSLCSAKRKKKNRPNRGKASGRCVSEGETRRQARRKWLHTHTRTHKAGVLNLIRCSDASNCSDHHQGPLVLSPRGWTTTSQAPSQAQTMPSPLPATNPTTRSVEYQQHPRPCLARRRYLHDAWDPEAAQVRALVGPGRGVRPVPITPSSVHLLDLPLQLSQPVGWLMQRGRLGCLGEGTRASKFARWETKRCDSSAAHARALCVHCPPQGVINETPHTRQWPAESRARDCSGSN